MKHLTDGAADGQRGNWYVLITKYAQEKRAQDNLTNQGVNCWLPRITVHSV
ncbi:transcription termination/antitermination NusG family protein, partial [Erwinia billingiae]|uniref:transcription termination/antitermination NusG family protein n=1 Tax=Erwinia billingiae TaxID=182337 RepID=UPI002AF6AB56